VYLESFQISPFSSRFIRFPFMRFHLKHIFCRGVKNGRFSGPKKIFGFPLLSCDELCYDIYYNGVNFDFGVKFLSIFVLAIKNMRCNALLFCCFCMNDSSHSVVFS